MKSKYGICLTIFVTILLLMLPHFAQADQYVFDHQSTIQQETIILNSILAACRGLLDSGQSVPGYCDSTCTSCNPNNTQRKNYVFSQGPTIWFTARRRELRESRRQDVCTLYRGASDSVRAQVDTLAGMTAIPTSGSSDTYQWSVTTNAAQEVVIQSSYRAECLRLQSSSQALPPGCTSACNCSAATTGNKLDHIFQEGFADWFVAERDRLREARYTQFCGLYIDLSNAVQDDIDELLGLPALP